MTSQQPEWIKWSGGECPIPVGTLHQRWYREGGYGPPLKLAEEHARRLIWAHDRTYAHCDIVAYRVLPA